MLIVRLRREDRPEERLVFDKPEISLGRDSGNDVTLSDGSVSKFHALLARVGNGIVVSDLGSTNGTFVNGSPIGAPVTVGEHDEIAIGGAILVIDPATLQPAAQPAAAGSGPPPPLPRTPPASVSTAAAAAVVAPTGPLPIVPSAAVPPNAVATTPPLPPVPGRPRAKPRVASSPPNADTIEIGTVKLEPTSEANSNSASAPASKKEKRRGKESREPSPSEAGVESQSPAAEAVSSAAPLTADGIGAYATRLVERVGEAMDTEPFTGVLPPAAAGGDPAVTKLDAVLQAEARALGIPEPIYAQVVAAVRSEYLDVGAIGAWLHDPTVTHIECFGPRRIELTRGGRVTPAEISYSGRAALHRAVKRLAAQSGDDWSKGELVVERRMKNGGRFVALLPPLASTICLTVRKPERVTQTMEDLVATRSVSERVAQVLARAMQSRANIVVCGESEHAVLRICAALAASAPAAHRLCVVHGGAEIGVDGRSTVAFGLPVVAAEEESTLRTAVQLELEHTFALSPKASVAASAVVAMCSGAEGVIAGTQARTLARGLMNIEGELMLSRPGLGFDAACALLAEAVDVAVEVQTSLEREPRLRIVQASAIASAVPHGASGLTLRELEG